MVVAVVVMVAITWLRVVVAGRLGVGRQLLLSLLNMMVSTYRYDISVDTHCYLLSAFVTHCYAFLTIGTIVNHCYALLVTIC